MEMRKGRCLCGRVRFEFQGPENWRGHCHCESCRRSTSSPLTTWLGVPRAGFAFTGELPKIYVSSPGVRRSFCGTCGAPMAYENERFPDEIHLYAASLDNPEDFEPDFHVHYAERLSWLHLQDTLPKYDRSGSG